MNARATCCNCDKDCTARHFLCEVQGDSAWCPDCFALTACAAGVHGEGCHTQVISDEPTEKRVA